MKLYDRVKDLLERYPELRNSDKKLVWATWYTKGLIVDGKIDRDSFYKAVSSDSITRARRKIQEHFRHLRATEKVRGYRKQKQDMKGAHVYHEND
jgi:hypothetical protein